MHDFLIVGLDYFKYQFCIPTHFLDIHKIVCGYGDYFLLLNRQMNVSTCCSIIQ